MTTTLQEPAKTRTVKEAELSEKATEWCRKVAGVAAKRAFRVKALAKHRSAFDPSKVKFVLLPKIYHRKRVSHTDGKTKILLHPQFFDEKGNIRKKRSIHGELLD